MTPEVGLDGGFVKAGETDLRYSLQLHFAEISFGNPRRRFPVVVDCRQYGDTQGNFGQDAKMFMRSGNQLNVHSFTS